MNKTLRERIAAVIKNLSHEPQADECEEAVILITDLERKLEVAEKALKRAEQLINGVNQSDAHLLGRVLEVVQQTLTLISLDNSEKDTHQ